jgi:hypothetical protein
VEVPRNDLWAFGSRDFSVELWVQFHAVPPSPSIGQPGAVFIGSDEGHGGCNKWFFAHGGGVLYFHVGSPALGEGAFLAQAPFSPALRQWYHLAVTRSRGTFTMYVNGAPVASQAVTVVIPHPDASLTIGQAEGLGFVNGLLDEVAVYDRALSPAEVRGRSIQGRGS